MGAGLRRIPKGMEMPPDPGASAGSACASNCALSVLSLIDVLVSKQFDGVLVPLPVGCIGTGNGNCPPTVKSGAASNSHAIVDR